MFDRQPLGNKFDLIPRTSLGAVLSLQELVSICLVLRLRLNSKITPFHRSGEGFKL